MNLNQIRFSCESMTGTNKVGLLQKDENGYYEMIVGGLNVQNESGAYYEYERARELFEGSSQLMRRVKRGALRGEYGHPRPSPNQTKEQFAYRVLDIDPKNVCCHHRELYLDFDRVKDQQTGKPVIAIMSKVLPSGPMGQYLEASLENKHENVCFSIRAFTNDSILNGRPNKVLRNVVTFDYVIEPGIPYAEKFKSPSLESLLETTFSRGELERCAQVVPVGMATESVQLNTSELFRSMGWSLEGQKAPIWSSW